MPTILEEGEYKFIVHTHELPYEPPHVHIRFGGEEVRINLDSGHRQEEGEERSWIFTRRT